MLGAYIVLAHELGVTFQHGLSLLVPAAACTCCYATLTQAPRPQCSACSQR